MEHFEDAGVIEQREERGQLRHRLVVDDGDHVPGRDLDDLEPRVEGVLPHELGIHRKSVVFAQPLAEGEQPGFVPDVFSICRPLRHRVSPVSERSENSGARSPTAGTPDMGGLYAGCPGWATSGRAVCLRTRRGRWRDEKKAAYLRRNGLESSPVKPVTVSSSIPFLPSGTVTVIVLSSTWVNLAAPPGPKETILTHPGSPKCSPAIVTLSPVLPSSGVTFLILGVAPEQLLPFVSRGDSEALALLLWIPPPGCAVAAEAFSFFVSSAATARPTSPTKANTARIPTTRATGVIVMIPSSLQMFDIQDKRTGVMVGHYRGGSQDKDTPPGNRVERRLWQQRDDGAPAHIGEDRRRRDGVFDERLGVDTQDQRAGQAHVDDGLERAGDFDRRGVSRLADVHFLHYDQVVVQRDHDADQPHHDQSVETLLNRRDEQVELADKTCQRRHAGQREQEDQHGEREERRTPVQAVVVFDLVAVGGLAEGNHDREGPQVGEQVGEQVEQDRIGAHARSGGHPDQDVPDLGDPGVGQ